MCTLLAISLLGEITMGAAFCDVALVVYVYSRYKNLKSIRKMREESEIRWMNIQYTLDGMPKGYNVSYGPSTKEKEREVEEMLF